MADWLRADGLEVIEYSGWKTRARGSSGYTSNPLCVMWHHTASNSSWDGQKDADYCTVGDTNSPLANLYINRAGIVWVCAAGATNTNGSGNSIQFSRGTVPVDGMNSRAVGIECGNNGVGERWPQSQIDAMFATSNCINRNLGNLPSDVSSHQFYAPSRKIDPATGNVEGPWVPRTLNSSGTWDRNSIIEECNNRANNSIPIPPTPTPIPPYNPDPDDEDEMAVQLRVRFEGYKNVFLYEYNTFTHLTGRSDGKYQNVPLEVWDAHPQGMKGAIAKAGLEMEDMIPE